MPYLSLDGGGELERSEKLFDICSDNSRGIGSEQMGNVADGSNEYSRREVGKSRDESIDKASDGDLQESICTLKGCQGDVENDVNVDSSLRDYVVNEPCSKYFETSSSVREMFDNSERLPINCSTTENMEAPESESSTCLARSRDGSISSDSSGRCMHPKGMLHNMYRNLYFTIVSLGKDAFLSVAEAATSPSSKCENCNLLGTCVLCSKNKRYISTS